jgi:hypothetical protein
MSISRSSAIALLLCDSGYRLKKVANDIAVFIAIVLRLSACSLEPGASAFEFHFDERGFFQFLKNDNTTHSIVSH